MEVEHLENDYRLSSPAYPPTALSCMIFESDVPASWKISSVETSIIKFDTIIECMARLPLLEKFTIRTDVDFSVFYIINLITHCTKLTALELSGKNCRNTHLEAFFSGLSTGKYANSWSLKGTRSEMIERLSSVGCYGQASTSIGNPMVY